MRRILVTACVLVLCSFGFLQPEAQAGATRRSSEQFAAKYGYRHTDQGGSVLLMRGTFPVRIYPETDRVLMGGREYRVKDRFDREAGRVMISGRVERFLARQARTLESVAQSRLNSAQRPSAPLPKLEPLPPRRVPAARPRKPKRVDFVKPVARERVRVAGDADWVPQGVSERRWKWIIVHHSDDQSGDLAKYDRIHRESNKWENGCGYHFVIGNGSKSGDGEIEIGPRWERQIQGAHAKVPGNRFNEKGVGICLVGDFDEDGGRPTAAQMDSLVRLIRWLKARYSVADANLHGHCDCCATRCPGRYFPWDEVRRRTR